MLSPSLIICNERDRAWQILLDALRSTPSQYSSEELKHIIIDPSQAKICSELSAPKLPELPLKSDE